ncbi:class I SAM-dependent methyltransferase [Nocardioides sp. JQ2195]|uniref:class I SAM-dependent methyltransferase n=1 Tax=Nocardioides sp. JQ2195 TaxID=2592334 RepID=UPI00143EE226|nr:class I SAM-dependent methyltransferase [Nocardioides sp. JQ2195]QIX26203.1 class I SAM-dependent methyltransferase [Nocardioides sp. JQ2195]
MPPNRNSTRRFQLFDALLRQVPTGRVVDLGAGHGAFSVRAADAGWDVTAVDARSTRFPDDPRVTWLEKDIREVDLTDFDLVLCLGLFYHLTVDDQVALLDRAAGRPLILDTHVATRNPTHELSEIVTAGGYKGRLYDEKGWERRPTASWENEESFWPTGRELYRMLADHGYPAVFAGVPWVVRDRTFFLCLPE